MKLIALVSLEGLIVLKIYDYHFRIIVRKKIVKMYMTLSPVPETEQTLSFSFHYYSIPQWQ